MRLIRVMPLGVALLLGFAGAVSAHGDPAGGGTSLAPFAVAAVGILYGWGLLRQRTLRWTAALAFGTGWLILTVAVVGPLEHAANKSLAAHMIQHMLLIAVAPPLLLWARPLPVLLAGPPRGLRQQVAGPALRVYRRAAARGLSAFLVHAAALWVWHLPGPYQAALGSRLLHDAEHATFFLTALWLWWTLLAPLRSRRGVFTEAVLFCVMTMAHMGLLGALLTFASRRLYLEHPAGLAGLDAMADQQLAGLVMWVPGGLIYTALVAILFAAWLQRMERLDRDLRV